MARNYFADPFATGQAAFAQGFDTTQGMTDQIRRRKAGRALASGDRQGAMQAFGEGGMTDDVRQLQADERALEQQAYERGRDQVQDARQAKQDETADADRTVQILTRIAQGLKTVPAGQRKAALSRAYPLFQAMELDTAMFDGLSEDQLSDQQLDMFTGELEKQFTAMNLGSGGVGVFNARTGDFKTLREPDPRPVIVGNGGVALDPDTGEVIARNPKAFAPPRAGSGGGLNSVSTEDLIKAVRGY